MWTVLHSCEGVGAAMEVCNLLQRCGIVLGGAGEIWVGVGQCCRDVEDTVKVWGLLWKCEARGVGAQEKILH